VTLTPATGLITYEDENGTMATFGIALNSPPSKDVTIALSSSDEGEGTVNSRASRVHVGQLDGTATGDRHGRKRR
jgi:hypothetical protein